MSQAIEMSHHKSQYNQEVTVLKVRGTIDSETAPAYENKLETILEAGLYRLLVDLEEVEYISSAGVGVFVGMLQKFREFEDQGGDIKACNVSKKIMKVFESIGLDGMMDFVENSPALKEWEAEAQIEERMNHFFLIAMDKEIYSGEEFVLRIGARDVDKKLVEEYIETVRFKVSSGMIFPKEAEGFDKGIWEGKIVITGSGKVTVSVTDGKYSGLVELDIQEKEGKAQFPLKVNCTTCKAEITIQAPEIYRCEECDETFNVDEWGNVHLIKTGSTAKRRKSKYKGIEMKINADVNYLSTIRRVIEGLCAQEGMDEITTNSVSLAIDEILLNLIEHGNDFDPWQILRLSMMFQKKQVKIQIRDYGDPFDVTKQKNISIKSRAIKGSKRGVGGFMVNKLMDNIKYESLPNYNQLTMVKKYGSGEEDDE
jgi:anti-sigma B factor antagonist